MNINTKPNKKRRKKIKRKVTAINIYLPNDLVSKIKSKAQQQGLTMASYIRMLLINNHKE